MVIGKEDSSQIRAAEQLEKVATELAEKTKEIPKPSDISALLLSLSSVQSTLDAVYAHLAQWHGQSVQGTHHAGQDERGDPDDPGWIRAEIALREAAQYGADAAEALVRAHSANEVTLWFDEIRNAGDL
ncbi:hypothetical protein [Glaciibacter superstes]|uniref:hypothetical protein n=1 Tax=Glaciibacter superstes TaxID=501023 RepID=UPI000413EB6D|nr:hypothetical protein [Glaciibacter superstes]